MIFTTQRFIQIFLYFSFAVYSVQTTFANEIDSASSSSWYLKPTFGFSSLSDTDGSFSASTGDVANAAISTDSGFASGLTLGYGYDNNWIAEFGWEYRSNDAATNLSNASNFPEGDYASNTFFLNGLYEFDSQGSWTPYLGAGLMLVQEIDIDLESSGQELSFSDSGNVGFQFIAGVNREINEQWSVDLELRYADVSGVDLTGEVDNTAVLNDLDYSSTTLQIGLRYSF